MQLQTRDLSSVRDSLVSAQVSARVCVCDVEERMPEERCDGFVGGGCGSSRTLGDGELLHGRSRRACGSRSRVSFTRCSASCATGAELHVTGQAAGETLMRVSGMAWR